jgi:regulator of protease activity HflC (stomatin/prohibitin superfamily)
MFGIFVGVLLLLGASALMFVPLDPALSKLKMIGSTVMIVLAGIFSLGGAVGYNDAGFCQHVRTIFGNETATCETGWYFAGWGTSTAWPHYITVAHTLDATGENAGTVFQGSIAEPYRVRLADNWTGDVTQTTRFGIPQDTAQFLEMARTFRTPERLINTTLKPAVTASLDSVSNMFTMEEYYSGGKRDQFKSEFKDAIEKGRAQVRQISLNQAGGVIRNRVAASDSDAAQDTSEVGDTEVRKVLMEKITDASGNDVRTPHDFTEIGVTVASAILENIDPDDEYERQIGERKKAASRRVVAREQRLEQEEQRLLAIQQGETDIAKRQAEAKVNQIEQTTNAETTKKLALIEAERVKEEAEIARQTAAINLERARIDAEAVTVAADAEAYAKEAILTADGALAQKLEAWVAAQRVWADAASKINVPATVIAGGGDGGTAGNALGTVDQFMQMLMIKTAKDLQVDPTIAATPVKQ